MLLLTAFFAVLSGLIFMFHELLLRATCVGHGAFVASRKTGVASMGGSMEARAHASTLYHSEGGFLRGYVEADARTAGRHPKLCTVRLVDCYRTIQPTGGRDGAMPATRVEEIEVPTRRVTTAGTSHRSLTSDNEL